MTTTTTNLKSEVINGERWVECSCGAGEYLPKQLTHRRACRTREQWSDVPVSTTTQPAESLRTFAAKVRRTGLTKGRDEDVRLAVEQGHLSIDDAMNTDD